MHLRLTSGTKKLIFRLSAVMAMVAGLAVATSACAQAKFIVLPSVLPAEPPQVEISADCDAGTRGQVLAALNDLRSFSITADAGKQGHESKASSGLVMRAVSRGHERFVVFHAAHAPGLVSTKAIADCLTIFAGSSAMVDRLHLYVPDHSVPLGWFTYSRRLGIYTDPRTVNLFPANHG